MKLRRASLTTLMRLLPKRETDIQALRVLASQYLISLLEKKMEAAVNKLCRYNSEEQQQREELVREAQNWAEQLAKTVSFAADESTVPIPAIVNQDAFREEVAHQIAQMLLAAIAKIPKESDVVDAMMDAIMDDYK